MRATYFPPEISRSFTLHPKRNSTPLSSKYPRMPLRIIWIDVATQSESSSTREQDLRFPVRLENANEWNNLRNSRRVCPCRGAACRALGCLVERQNERAARARISPGRCCVQSESSAFHRSMCLLHPLHNRCWNPEREFACNQRRGKFQSLVKGGESLCGVF